MNATTQPRDVLGRFTHLFHGPGVTEADNDGASYLGYGPSISPVALALGQMYNVIDETSYAAEQDGQLDKANRLAGDRELISDLMSADGSHRWNWRTPGQMRLDDLAEARADLTDPDTWLLIGGVAVQVRKVAQLKSGTWVLTLADGSRVRLPKYSTVDWTYAGYRSPVQDPELAERARLFLEVAKLKAANSTTAAAAVAA